MQKAVAAALALHLVLLLSPAIVDLEIALPEIGFELHVKLEENDKAIDDINQRLYSTDESNLNTEPDLSFNDTGTAPTQVDQQSSSANAGEGSDSIFSTAMGQSKRNSTRLPSIFSRQSLLTFAKQEAVKYADANPDQVQRFNRSFRSRAQYRQRKRHAFRNQYGDTYLGKGASRGDICFVKTAEPIRAPAGTQDAPTYTVHFFRCEDKANRK